MSPAMRLLSTRLFLFILMSAPAFATTQDVGITFETHLTWKQALAKAKVEGKYIFLDAYATWCAPCIEMDKTTYTSRQLGEIFEKNFVSIKLQMDKTENDSAAVRGQYVDAARVEKQYAIHGFPTLLFFSPDGRLASKASGYKNVDELRKLAFEALDPGNIENYGLVDSYRKGIKDLATLKQLATFTKTIVGNDNLARTMADDYLNYWEALDDKSCESRGEMALFAKNIGKNNERADRLGRDYIGCSNQWSEEKLLDKEKLELLEHFANLVTSKDKYFQLCYQDPKRVNNALMGPDGSFPWAESLVTSTITNERLSARLEKERQPVTTNPPWDELTAELKSVYPEADARLIVLEYQVHYYSVVDPNWREWFKYKDEYIKQYLPADGSQNYFILNVTGGWDAFLHCSDIAILAKAVSWMDRALEQAVCDADRYGNRYQIAAYLDTKANLLYKAGSVKDALFFEDLAVRLSAREDRQSYDEIQATYKKMREGTPTWPDDGTYTPKSSAK